MVANRRTHCATLQLPRLCPSPYTSLALGSPTWACTNDVEIKTSAVTATHAGYGWAMSCRTVVGLRWLTSFKEDVIADV